MSLVQLGRPAGSTPRREPPAVHVIDGAHRIFFVVEGSRIYLGEKNADPADFLHEFERPDAGPPVPQVSPEPAALSLNIAQSCNLACAYCYADEGRFGGESQMMSFETAQGAIRQHIARASQSQVSVGFIGGEPVLNRDVLHRATRYAAELAASRGTRITFGITTNGTLLRSDDIELLRSYPFAVNISVDGGKSVHDALRPARDGKESFQRTIDAVRPLIANPGKASVAARVTVTRWNMDVSSHLRALADAGFEEIGVSAMRTGPDPELRITGPDWRRLLDEMKIAAEADWRRVRSSPGLLLRFTNFSTALRQLYRGAYHALPCGAAANYVSLSAGGRYYTCHRTINHDRFDLGDLESGPSLELRRAFVAEREVDRQEPCRSCWARYLCGGGCHAEVIQMGRDGCDYIRGWLEFCIGVYPEVLAMRPDLLKAGRSGESLL